MKNNIKKVPVKFGKDLLYFQHFMLIFIFAPNLWIQPPYGFPYHAGYNNMIFKDKLKSIPE